MTVHCLSDLLLKLWHMFTDINICPRDNLMHSYKKKVECNTNRYINKLCFPIPKLNVIDTHLQFANTNMVSRIIQQRVLCLCCRFDWPSLPNLLSSQFFADVDAVPQGGRIQKVVPRSRVRRRQAPEWSDDPNGVRRQLTGDKRAFGDSPLQVPVVALL